MRITPRPDGNAGVKFHSGQNRVRLGSLFEGLTDVTWVLNPVHQNPKMVQDDCLSNALVFVRDCKVGVGARIG